MWEGGKNNERRLHLVSWDKIKKPILEGGLQIRNIVDQNLALQSKLLWNLVYGHTSESKKVLWKKYFKGSRSRCLDKPPRTLTGSPIFKLCLTTLEHFKSNLYWIPGNGQNIRYWDDSILGDQPLEQKAELANIKKIGCNTKIFLPCGTFPPGSMMQRKVGITGTWERYQKIWKEKPTP